MSIDKEKHFLNLSNNGRLQASGELHTPAAQVARLFAHFEQSEKPSMTLFFHGGVNSEANGVQLAAEIFPEIDENFDSYPLFFIWESGIIDIVRNQLQDIQQDAKLFDKLLKKLLKHAARLARQLGGTETESLIDEGGVDLDRVTVELEQERLTMLETSAFSTLDALLPTGDTAVSMQTDAQLAALESDLENDIEANIMLAAIVAQARKEQAGEESFSGPTAATDYLSATVLADLMQHGGAAAETSGEEEAFILPGSSWVFVSKVLLAIGKRFVNGSHHGFLATVLEELYRHLYLDKIGSFLWSGMKQAAADAYLVNPAGPPSDDNHGGTLFISLLQEHIAAHGPVKLNLVGHSAGAIHICHFVEKACQELGPDFTIENVLFLAPACSFAQFTQGIVQFEAQIKNFRLFTMNDERERADHLIPTLPFLYPHSLLYLVSGILEEQGADTPLLGLARHLQEARYLSDPAVKKGRDFLTAVSGVVYAPAKKPQAPLGARADFSSHAGAHGPNKDQSTLASLAHMIRPPMRENNAELVESEPVMADVDELPASYQKLFAPSHSMRFVAETEKGQQTGGTSAVKTPPTAMDSAGLNDGFDDPVFAFDGGDTEAAGMAELDDPFSGMEEAIIGDNDLVDHGLIEGLLARGRSVGRVNAPAVVGFASVPPEEREGRWREAAQLGQLKGTRGTGWIFGSARRVLLTNNHVLPLPVAAGRTTVELGYERDGLTGTVGVEKVIRLHPTRLFVTSVNMRFDGLDYTAVGLREPAPEEFGFLEFSTFDTVDFANKVYIVQHPNGEPKKYIVNHNPIINRDDDGRYFTYASDTMRGSSGSPLFDDALNLIGIHHIGNFKLVIGEKEIFSNLGSRMETVLHDLAQQLHGQSWNEEKIVEWFGDGSLLTVWQELFGV